MSSEETVVPGASVHPPPDLVIDLAAARIRRGPAVGHHAVGDPDVLFDDHADLLHRVTVVLSSTLELDEVLNRLARIALEATHAARCSLFLVDRDHLRPAVALGRVADQDLATAFQEMGPIRRATVDAAWRRIRDGGTLVVADARRSTLFPPEWVERFDLDAVVVVPLVVGGDTAGVMVVDYPDGDVVGDEQVQLLETLTGCAAIAVRNARVYAAAERRVAAQQVLARSAAALVDVDSPTAFAAALVDGYAQLLGADPCAIGLFDASHTHVTTLAIHGRGQAGPIPVSNVPSHIIRALTTAWTADPTATVAFDADPWFAEMADGGYAPSYRVVPLTVGGVPRGCIVLGRGEGVVRDPESHAAAEALRDLATAALERTWLLERVQEDARRMEVLFATSSAVVAGDGADVVVSQLRHLLAEQAIDVVDMALLDRSLLDRFDARRPTPVERAAWRARTVTVEVDAGTTSVGMQVDGRVIGGLRVRVDDPARLPFVEAVASGVAEVLIRAALRAALEDAAGQVAIAAERDRIAADLHDTAGQLLVAIGLLGRRACDRLPPDSPLRGELGRIAELADGGKWEIDQAVRALTHVPAGERGLPASLAALADDFQHDSGINVLVDVIGTPQRLPPDRERALYRVAHEALSNAWRHARAAAVHVTLSFADDVRLTVVDDGVGLTGGRHRAGVGLLSIRRALEQAGGLVVVADAEPRGVRVEARVPGTAQ